MSLKDIRESALAAVAEFEAGNWVAGGRKLVEVQSGFLDIAADLGFRAEADDDAVKAEIKAALEKCDKIVGETKTETVQGRPTVGKLGDGVLLKILLEAALKFLPLFI